MNWDIKYQLVFLEVLAFSMRQRLALRQIDAEVITDPQQQLELYRQDQQAEDEQALRQPVGAA